MKRLLIAAEVLIHVLVWLALYAFGSFYNFYLTPFSAADGTMAVANAYGYFFNALLFYLNAFYLVPKFFGKKPNWSYWLIAALIVLGISLIESVIDGYYANYVYLQSNDLTVGLGVWDWGVAWFQQNVPINSFFFLISWAYIGPRAWMKDRRLREQLEKEQLRTELNYLKAQINPHFLFNGINSVYHLIDGDPQLAKTTLHKFSNLLRYQLYECNDELIPLDQELNYLENFITLEQIRKGSDATIQWEINADDRRKTPLLLTPFIENAFKYLSHHLDSTQNVLNIQLDIEENSLDLEVFNTFVKSEKPKEKSGGLGLKNVKRRLALLYPGKHRLKIQEEMNVYKVSLNIQLDGVVTIKSDSPEALRKS